MLKSILAIGGHMIRARVFEVIGDLENANEEMLDAGLIAQSDGYHHAFKSGEHSEPGYLDTYPELRPVWEHGYGQGLWGWEIEHCRSCQDPDIAMCPVHDRIG